MPITERTEKEVKDVTYTDWVCDECGKMIGTSRQYDDGYSPRPHGSCEIKVDATVFISGNGIIPYKSGHEKEYECLCRECAVKVGKRIQKHLEDAGIKKYYGYTYNVEEKE